MAQDAARLPLVGALRINTAANIEPIATMLRDALGSLGHIDGKTFRLEFRLAEGNPARLPELATALVRDEPRVILAGHQTSGSGHFPPLANRRKLVREEQPAELFTKAEEQRLSSTSRRRETSA
jgi:hypothetical protein